MGKKIKIGELLPVAWQAGLSERELALEVAGVTSDSRRVAAGWVFVAVRGGTSDGHRFIGLARQQGAALVIGEEDAAAAAPYVRVADSRKALALAAAAFHGHPSHAMKMIGVTGTSGKTTTTYLIEAILKAAGYEVGIIGTVAFRYKDKVLDSTHTTPGAPELQAMLAEMRAGGCTAVVMEVSSHALKQQRAAGIAFDAMAFTNLTPEHMDFHPDMEDYFGAKALLFRELAESSVAAGKRPVAAINADDAYGKRLLAEAKGSKSFAQVLGVSLDPIDGISASALTVDLSGIRGKIAGIEVASPLTGRFNAANIAAAVAVARGLGAPDRAIADGIAATRVPGRLEPVPNSRGIHVLVDYAHKSDALEKVLKTLRAVRAGHRLITVFGCGGDRDRDKRPVMGRLAVELSDQVFVTSDNPRTEDPGVIIQEILKGTAGHANFRVEADRAKAIRSAIALARAGDIVLIAGKGHEDYQIIGKTKIHFDDREVAREALSS